MKSTLLLLFIISSTTLFAQSILTRGEVYDFEIGDEFQYSFNNYPGIMVERYVVIDKQFSQNNDTIFYRLSESYYSNGPDGNGGTAHYFSEDTINQTITNLNNPITSFGDSVEIYDIYLDSTYFYHPDTIIEYDSNLCGLEVNGWSSFPPVFEPNTITRIAGKGVGSVWRYHHDPSSPMSNLEDRKLYYYKKGNITCGSPVTVSIESFDLNDNNVKIYPIPANEKINIELTNNKGKIQSLRLIDTQGKSILIDVQENFANTYTFESKDIPNGVYSVHFTTIHSSFKRRVIINH